MDEASKVARRNERDHKIDVYNGINASQKHGCEYLKSHIDMMYQLKGEHLNDIPHYITQLEGCPDLERYKIICMFKQIDLEINNNASLEQLKITFLQICGLVEKYVQTHPIDAIYLPRLVTLFNTLNRINRADPEMHATIMKLYESSWWLFARNKPQNKKVRAISAKNANPRSPRSPRSPRRRSPISPKSPGDTETKMKYVHCIIE